MKTNELQLKDWILQNGYPSRVVLLINNYIETETMADDREPCTFEPIPLTAEILEKNGFVLVDNDLFEREINAGHSIQYDILHCHFDEYEETGYEEPIEEHNFHCELVSKVHELQHALRLCGLAELADNFKV